MMRTLPSRPTTISPEVRPEMISPLSRSDASARAAVARSWALRRAMASSRATESISGSRPCARLESCRWRAAENRRIVANISRPDRAPIIAVSPKSAAALEFIAMPSIQNGRSRS
jgi:hypothetical protein